MNEQKRIKDISIGDIERAIAKAISEMTGTETSVNVSSFSEAPFEASRFVNTLEGKTEISVVMSLFVGNPGRDEVGDDTSAPWGNDKPF